ncbi:MAG: hypothetical protein OEY00_13565 [Gammaproteobacteria bacterium]|nr:hypothetical protein [Gammaproteobacteria bacterium]
MFTSDMFRTMILPFLVFVLLMVGLTALFQHTLFIYKLAGSYIHWAVILLILPILLGMLLRVMGTENPLIIVLSASLVSAWCLFYLYKFYFWAQAPTFVNGLFLFAVVAGCAHLPYSRGPVERFIDRIQLLIKDRKKRRRNRGRSGSPRVANSRREPSIVQSLFNQENVIPLIEMTVGLASLFLSVYSIAFMGKG